MMDWEMDEIEQDEPGSNLFCRDCGERVHDSAARYCPDCEAALMRMQAPFPVEFSCAFDSVPF